MKVGDDHESQPKEELNVSELSDGYWSEFENNHWNKQRISDQGSLWHGMNDQDSFKNGAESQIKRPPIEASELVEIDDVRVRFAEGDPLGQHPNNPEVSPLDNILDRVDTRSNVPIRNHLLADPRLTGVVEV